MNSLPDLISARLAAAQQDTRVEVTSLRDEYSNTYVNHDGTLTTETSSTPLRLQRDGNWVDIDYDLQHVDGGWSPKVSPVPVVFSDGADADAVSIGAGTRQVDLSWDVTLPKPTIDGSKASYDLGGGETLVLAATSTGFEQSLVLAQAPTTLPQIKLPLDTADLTLVPNAGGGYDFLNASGSVVYTMQAPVMYGSAIDPNTEEPAQSKVVASTLVQTSSGPRLDLSPSLAWLQDPSTTYPVTIDPSVSAVSGGADTYVQDNVATAQGSATVLHVGEYAGTDPARSYLKWTTGMANYTGKHIQSATLNLWNWNVGSCTAATIHAYPLTSSFTTGATVWTNKPTYTTSSTYAGLASFAHGIDGSCPNAAASIDVTKIVAAWAAGTMDPANGLQLSGTETSGSQYWGFCSMDYVGGTGSCNTPAHVPTLSITYNSYPSTPTSRSVKPCSAQCTGTILTSSATPKVTAKANDPDGGTLRDDFEVWAGNSPSPTTEITSGSVSNVTAGSTATWTVPTSTLTNGSTYEYRVRAWDGTDYSSWSGWTVFKIDTTVPATPTFSSTAWTNNGWTTNTSGSITWSDTSTDVASYSYQVDGGGWSTPSTGTIASLSGLALGSWHTLTVQATDTAGNVSTDGTFGFGVGTGGLTSPAEDGRTQARVTLSAKGAAGYGWVWYQWRQGTTSFWNNLSSTDVTVPGTNNPPSVWPVVPIGDSYVWNLANTVAAAGGGDGLVQVRACVATSSAGAGGVCQPTPVDVQLVKTAFGASYATEDVGPGSVSLLTGDYSLSENDVAEAGYQDQLSLDRSLTTLKPAAASATVTGVFGPAWTASLTGPDAGYGSYIPAVASDLSYINFTAEDGSALVYTATNALTSSTIIYQGVGGSDDGSAVTLDSTRTSIVLTDLDGSKTTWVQQSGQWVVSKVEETGTAANTTTTWVYGTTGVSAGLPVQIIAPTPYNLLSGNAACGAANAATTPGCRSLTFDYTSMTVGGSSVTRLSGVNLVAYNPNKSGGGGMDTVPVAGYDYDANGRLSHAWDPRITPALKITYTYDANNRLATLTPPGQATWTFSYDGSNRLITVSRPDPSDSTAVTTVVYDVPLSGSAVPFDLTNSTTSTWAQDDDLPTVGAAVFDADYAPSAGTAAALTSEDWRHAALTYLDVNGRAVDSANYADGAWQYSATAYNDEGHVVWSLSSGNLAQALNPTTNTDPAAAALASSADRADLLASINVYSSDGLKLTDSLGPIHPVQLSDGTQVDARAHTHTDFDEGAPTGGPYLMPTTTITSAQTTDGVDHDKVTSHTGYGAIVSGDTDGWTLRQPTTSTQQLGSSPSPNDLVTTTRYNTQGQVIESRLPRDAAGGHAGTTVTSYYTATGTGPCVSPALAGLVCSVGPAAQPSTGNPLPVTTYSYDMFGNVVTETETAGSTVRTTTTAYDAGERVSTTSVAVTPSGAGGTAVPTVTYGYDSATGLPTTKNTTSGGVTTTLTTGYDNLGRTTSYTDAGNVTSTTGYDLAGRPSTSFDGKATTSYSYDPYSGALTSEDIGVGPSPSTFSASYNGDGSLASQTYPNGLVQAYRYDNTGDPTTLTYTMGSSQWLQFSQTSNAQGQTVAQDSPQSIQQFSYDGAGRLSTVADTALSMTNWTISCTTRSYGFDRNSNRTGLSSYPDDGSNPSGGGCSTSTTPTVVGSTFDDADRITNTGYAYDTLGRTTTVPAADAVSISSVAFISGPMAVGYYANDYVASETQGAYTASFGLDPDQNREAKLTFGANVATYHYSDDSDSPSWYVDDTGAWTRYISGIDGNLAATQSSNGTVELNLPNLHGDIVASVPDSTTATGIDGYSESTEYGQPRNISQSYNTYGWLGGKQRSSNSLGGMILMGIRVYNPVTGRFLSVDPVAGGNTDAYTYPVDPIGDTDLTGRSLDAGNGGGISEMDYPAHWKIRIAGRMFRCRHDVCTTRVAAPESRSGAAFKVLQWLTKGFSLPQDYSTSYNGVMFRGHGRLGVGRYGMRWSKKHGPTIDIHVMKSKYQKMNIRLHFVYGFSYGGLIPRTPEQSRWPVA